MRKRFKNEKTLFADNYRTNTKIGNLEIYDGVFLELDLDSFPLISDFKVDINKFRESGLIYYYSENNGLLTYLLWSSHIGDNLNNMTVEKIPCGTMSKPFWDVDQGYSIVIFENNEYVYIMNGQDRSMEEGIDLDSGYELFFSKFPIWFKVAKKEYINEWVKILSKY